MSNYLQSLATIGTALALETAHFEDLATAPDTVKEVNTTPSGVLQALSRLGDYEKAINAAIKSVREVIQQQMTYRGYQISPSTFIHYVCDQLMIDLVTQISWRLVLPPGRVSLYITPSDITDSNVIALAGQGLMYTAERSHLAPNKLLISVPATYAGIQAARILERGNGAVKISCNMRAVVTPTQAIACAQAGLTRISVPISAIKRWHIENGTDNPFLDLEDIKCHPGINFVKRMISIFNDHRYATQIVAEDFSTVEEVTALAGVKEMILPNHLIEALSEIPGPAVNTLARVHGIDFSRDQNSLPKRLNGQAPGDFDLDTFNQNAGPIYTALTEEFLLKTRTDMDELRKIVKGVAACDPGMANWLNGFA